MVDYRLPPLRPGLSTSPSTYSHSRPYSHERDRGSTASGDIESTSGLSPTASTPKSESRPMSAVLAALANEDVEYTGIVRPLRDGTYDRNDRYLPPLERLASGSAGPSRLSDYGPLSTHGWEENYRSVQPDVRRGSDASDVKPRHFESSNGIGGGSGPRDTTAAGPSRDNHSLNNSTGSGSGSNNRKNGVTNESKDRPAPTSPEATQKKKKRKVNPAKPTEHIPEGAEVEYEQDGDPMRGPVFVHPPKDAVQACVRCHRIKRKCDGARPRCSACTKADVPCVFELSPATSAYVHKLKKEQADLLSDLEIAQQRIAQLEKELHDGPVFTTAPPSADFPRLARDALSMREHSAAVNKTANHISDLLTHEAALKATNDYIEFFQLAYPMFSKEDIVPRVHALYGEHEGNGKSRDTDPDKDRWKFIVLMILALGTACAERLGDVAHAAGRGVFEFACRYRSKALDREDLALLLLEMYAMVDPSAVSLWQTLGLAGRVIVAIGLNRRAEASTPIEVAEKRRRVFYSFFNLDRVVAPALGRPVTIEDHDIDIDEPTEQPGDVTYRHLPHVVITRHLIWYRRLLGEALRIAYSINGEQNKLPEPERKQLILDLHDKFTTWYNATPTSKGTIPRTINHARWWEVNLNQALCMIYRPSPLYPQPNSWTLRNLFVASSSCVDLYIELWKLNKVAFNLVQIIALFVACISLLCCLCECDSRMRAAATPAELDTVLHDLGLSRFKMGAQDVKWFEEIRIRVKQCQDLFDVFGRAIPLSSKYRDIFSRLSEGLLMRERGNSRELQQQQEREQREREMRERAGAQAGQGGQGERAPGQGQGGDQRKDDAGGKEQTAQQGANTTQPDAAVTLPISDAPIDGELFPTATGEMENTVVGDLGSSVPLPVLADDENLDLAGAWDAMAALWDPAEMFGDRLGEWLPTAEQGQEWWTNIGR